MLPQRSEKSRGAAHPISRPLRQQADRAAALLQDRGKPDLRARWDAGAALLAALQCDDGNPKSCHMLADYLDISPAIVTACVRFHQLYSAADLKELLRTRLTWSHVQALLRLSRAARRRLQRKLVDQQLTRQALIRVVRRELGENAVANSAAGRPPAVPVTLDAMAHDILGKLAVIRRCYQRVWADPGHGLQVLAEKASVEAVANELPLLADPLRSTIKDLQSLLKVVNERMS